LGSGKKPASNCASRSFDIGGADKRIMGLHFDVLIVPMHADGSNSGAGSSPDNFTRTFPVDLNGMQSLGAIRPLVAK
jgi:hypothetical protein